MRTPEFWKPGLLWLLFLGPLFFISYGLANHWAAAQPAVPSIVFAWERHIPLVPWTILPYWSIDLFYGVSLLICTTRFELARHARRLLTAQILCIAGFMLFPMRFSTARPPVAGWAGQLFDALAGFDLPFNQAPSLHIVLLLILWDFYRRRVGGLGKAALHVWSALIGISVLTTYQHHFIDIPTGMLAGSLCLWLWPLDGQRPAWQWTDSPTRRRLATIYGIGALTLALLAGIDRPWWWLYWPAASLAFVALFYAGIGAGGFQKRENGRLSTASKLLLLPYRIGAWLNARCWTRSLPKSVAISEHIWLGRAPLPWEVDHHRFNQIIDVTSELALNHGGTRALGWLDLTEPTTEQLLSAAHEVQRAAERGPVLVCCALGFSRSAAVVATWLCIYGPKVSVTDALVQIRHVRPQVVLKAPVIGVIHQAVASIRCGQ